MSNTSFYHIYPRFFLDCFQQNNWRKPVVRDGRIFFIFWHCRSVYTFFFWFFFLLHVDISYYCHIYLHNVGANRLFLLSQGCIWSIYDKPRWPSKTDCTPYGPTTYILPFNCIPFVSCCTSFYTITFLLLFHSSQYTTYSYNFTECTCNT